MKMFLRLIFVVTFGARCFDLSAQDSTPPSIQASSPSAGSTIGSLTQITVNFSEPVANVTGTDLLVNGVATVSVSGSGAVYTFVVFEPPAYGPVQISWDPSHDIRDLSPAANRFNESAPGATWQYTLFDGVAPVADQVDPQPGVSLRSLTQIEVTFSEAVAGVEAGDLLINNVPAGELSILGVGRYRFSFSPPASGLVEVRWAAGHGIRDLALVPNNFAGGSWTYQLDPNFGLPNIRINEFLTANIAGLLDEDGEAQDWIEIWNYGTTEVNLGGYSLTDDPDDPGRWTFPSTNIAPGQFLVLFASGKDRKFPATAALRLHTNFKLGVVGEYLALFNAESPRVAISEFAPQYPEQRNDVSYGHDEAGGLKYFAAPSPGSPNGGSEIASALAGPHFNIARGYYDRPIELVLSHPVYGVSIRYTTDGSEPTLNNGQVYFAPLTISNTTPVRAAAFKSGFLPSATVTHTYLFLSQVLNQPANPPGFPTGPTVMGGYPADYEMDPEIRNHAVYGPQMLAAMKSLPSVSMVTSVDNMFGPTNGIYTHIAESQTLYRGVAWERPCSIEFIPNDGSAGFTIDCGVRMQGNASRNPQKTPKHPFRLLFKNDYGPGRLEAQVYPDSPVQSFNTLVMRADFNNSWLHWNPGQRDRGTRIRDGWVKDTWRAMGQPGSHTRYFHLYINGLYWGIYDFGERIDATMAANYLGGTPEEYDAIASKPVKAVDGDLIAYNAMAAAVKNRPQGVLTNYEAVLELLDVENFADYMILNFYGGNQDWGNDSNWNAIRRRTPDGRFKFVSWDGEQLIVNVNDNRVANSDVPAGLHTALVASSEYRLTFADRAHKHLFNEGALTTNAVIQRWNERANQVSLAVIAESARWGDYRRDVHQYSAAPYILYTRNTGTTNWLAEVNRLLTSYFPQRGGIFLSQLRTAGLYPSVNAPVFNRHGGPVARGFNLTMTASAPVYYTLDGSDPRVFGTGGIAPGALLYTGAVVLNQSAVVKARTRSGNEWSALNEASFSVASLDSPLRITEIMYNPLDGDAYEYLELQNVATSPFDVSRYTINAVDYVFPPDTILAPGQVIVLASATSPSNWSARYPGVVPFGAFGGKLDNGGEKLAIATGGGAVLWSVDYDDENGWPKAADGSGFSLEIIDVFGDPDSPANWRASGGLNGTPGSVTPPPTPGTIVINEIMADNFSAVPNGGTYPDWVELHNRGASAADLTGWSLSDDSNPRKFVIPQGTSIPAAGYLVIWCDTNSAAPGLHSQFALGRNGDSVFLFDAASNRVDAIGFGLQLPDFSVGRDESGWTLNQPTPGSANAAASLAPSSSLSINEWLANATPGGDDWIELHNRAALPVALGGAYLSNGESVHALTPLSFIAASGFVQLLADENPGANHVDFKLPASGGAIVLSSEAGVTLEQVDYGAQSQGASQGRLPDGAGSIVAFPISSSPGASNYLLAYGGPFLNEVLAINRSFITNTAGRTSDFVELRNTNSAPFDLSGMRLSTDREAPAEWTFPSGISIPAGGHLLVWFDAELPPTTTAGPFLNTGHNLDGESGGIWLFNAGGQTVDSVEFGFQIPNRSLGRTPAGSWTLLATPSPGTGNGVPATLGSATGLRINEWMASSDDGDDWFELFNAGTQPVALDGLYASDSPSELDLTAFALPALSFVDARGFVRIQADGNPGNGRDHANFSLNGEGETLQIYSPSLGVVDAVSFGGQAAGISQGRLPDGANTIANFPSSPTPGESNFRPIADVVVSEVLSHPDLPSGDAIELRNLSGTPVNLGGWYLSDSASEFRKFRIPDGTVLPAHGYLTYYQNQFGGGAGTIVPFQLEAAAAGEVWLSEAMGIGLTGRRSVARIGVQDPGVSSGRFPTTTDIDYPALNQQTFGAANTGPRIGPVVINEVMYHPPDIGGTTDNVLDEFVELHNITSGNVALHDAQSVAITWRLRGEVDYEFPAGWVVPSRSYLLLVSFDPVANPTLLSAFRSRYGVPASVPIVGPYRGKLGNSGGELALLKPQAGSGGQVVPYVTVDQIDYSDAYPWPAEADGSGSSMQRRRPFDYGNEPTNWKAEGATAGRANVTGSGYADSDLDGLPDNWEPANGLNPLLMADADQDADGDGRSSYQEYFEGTNPQSAGSRLVAPVIAQEPLSLAVSPGNPALFTVSATGTGPLAYQWRKNGELIPGARTNAYLLTDPIPSDAGEYTVVVWNSAGFAVSRGAILTVSIPPVVLLHPQSQIVNSNGTATFTVGGVGSGTLRYQWQFNGADIPNATNASLTVTGATLSNEGDYRALITDDFATAISDTARLTVKIAPKILIPPRGATNIVGSSVTFTVTASGSVPMSFQWRKGSLPLTNQILMTTNASFTLNNLQTNDTSAYRVVITNFATVGTPANSQILLYVLEPPVVLGEPTSITASVGETAGFSVSPGGSGPLFYQWYFQESPVPLATNAAYSIASVQPASQGAYRVRITNFVGSVSSAIATLTVAGTPPTILVQPRAQETVAGGSATFGVAAVGDGALSYQWRFGNGDLAARTSPELALSNVQQADVGLYSVRVSNPHGSTLSQAVSLSLAAPPQLSGLERLANGDVRMNLTGPVNRNYEIEYSSDFSAWSSLLTISYTNGVVPLTDASAQGVTNRFYRARLLD